MSAAPSPACEQGNAWALAESQLPEMLDVGMVASGVARSALQAQRRRAQEQVRACYRATYESRRRRASSGAETRRVRPLPRLRRSTAGGQGVGPREGKNLLSELKNRAQRLPRAYQRVLVQLAASPAHLAALVRVATGVTQAVGVNDGGMRPREEAWDEHQRESESSDRTSGETERSPWFSAAQRFKAARRRSGSTSRR